MKYESLLIPFDLSKMTVLKFVAPLLMQGHTMWMNNFYSLSALAKALKVIHETGCVGTLNRKDVLIAVKEKMLKMMILTA